MTTIPCASVRLSRFGRNRHGYLLVTDKRELVFATRKWFRASQVVWTSVEIDAIHLRMGWIMRTLTVETTQGRAVFRLYRNAPEYMKDLVEELRQDLRVSGQDQGAHKDRPCWWRKPSLSCPTIDRMATDPA